MRRVGLVACLLAAIPSGCADDGLPAPGGRTAAEPPARVRHEPPPAPAPATRSPLLADGDLGGWIPPDELLLRALALGQADRRAAVLAELAGLGPGPTVDTLRAGLRLRDERAAIACAARVEWQWLDGWECARAVALLTPELFRPATEADFENYRSYMGSVDVNALLEAIPDGDPVLDPRYLMGQLHRVLRAEHIPPLYRIVTASPGGLADGALGNLALLERWSDRYRVEAAAYDWEIDPAALPPPGDGLHPLLAEALRRAYLTEGAAGLGGKESGSPLFRWMMDSRPGPQDAQLVMQLVDAVPATDGAAANLFDLWLGLLPDAETDAFLRAREDDYARIALARRGDRDALAWLESVAADGALGFGVFLESAPDRARAWLLRVLLGEDDAAAREVLELLDGYLTADDAREPHMGITWRPDLFDGFEAAVAQSDVSAARRGSIAVIVPGCRTTRLARQVVAGLEDGFLDGFTDEHGELDWLGWPQPFLEVAAPAELRRLLRDRVREGGEEEREIALPMLWTIGDPEAAALLVEHEDELDWDEKLIQLARSPGPAVVTHLRGLAAAYEGPGWSDADAALAAALGLPERAAHVFADDSLPPAAGARDALLDGRPRDALALQLAAFPDEPFQVGEVGDPRVRSHLERLRRERHLGLYWVATAELALQDADARDELWSMLRDGRYRTQDCLDLFTRTLGHDLATIPFWISELESQCCRINLGGGQIFAELFDVEEYRCPWETSHERISRYWERYRGGFVWSRLAEHFVPAPE